MSPPPDLRPSEAPLPVPPHSGPSGALRATLAWFRRKPPPPRPLPGGPYNELVRYCRHLARQLRERAKDPALPAPQRRRAAEGLAEIRDVLGAHPLHADLSRLMEKIERDLPGEHRGN